DLHHALHLAEAAQHTVQRVDAVDHHLERVERPLVDRPDLRAGDVDARGCDRAAHRGEEAGRVDAAHLDLHRTEVAGRVVPLDLDPALRIAFHHTQAVDGVDGDAAAAGDEADDALARQRIAAAAEAHHHVVDAAHAHAALRLAADEAEELLQRA